MNNDNTNKYQNKIITIPNILTFFRLCLIPVIVWLYCFRKDYIWSTSILVLSGLTDVIDGIIARKFNMVSDFGKIFDPIADKLTQIITLFCLVTRFRFMIIPLVILTVKEIIAASLNMLAIKKTGKVTGAVWHGKLTTVLLYVTMAIHLIWFNITALVSNILIAVCTIVMLVSSILYTTGNIRILKAQA